MFVASTSGLKESAHMVLTWSSCFTFLEMDSKSHKAVHDIVMDRAWLKTLTFYVK